MSLPSTALYSTIWAALVLFCGGETGRARARAGGASIPWAWWTYSAGALLCAIFATGPRRLAGAVLVAWLLWLWRPGD